MSKSIEVHGLSGYNKGCRCDECRAAKREAGRAYYLKNREKILARTAAYQREHREARNERLSAWRERNREHLRTYHREWSEANRDRVRAHGARRRSKPEYQEWRSRYREENRDRERERLKRWRAENPDLLASQRAAYRQRHRERLREKNRAYYAEHRDEIRERARQLWTEKREYHEQWRASPEGRASRRASHLRRRARKREADHGCVSADSLAAIIEAAGGLCSYCDAAFEHMDHIMPLAKGGLHCVENLAPACSACNLRKGARVLPESDRPAPLVYCPI